MRANLTPSLFAPPKKKTVKPVADKKGFFTAMEGKLYTCPWVGDIKSFEIAQDQLNGLVTSRPGQGLAGIAMPSSNIAIAQNLLQISSGNITNHEASKVTVCAIPAFNVEDGMARMNRDGQNITSVSAQGSKFNTPGAGAIHRNAKRFITDVLLSKIDKQHQNIAQADLKSSNTFGFGVLLGGYPALFNDCAITIVGADDGHALTISDSKSGKKGTHLLLHVDPDHDGAFTIQLVLDNHYVTCPDREYKNKKLKIVLTKQQFDDLKASISNGDTISDKLRYEILNDALTTLEFNKAIRQTRVYSASQNNDSVYWDREFLNYIRYNRDLLEDDTKASTQNTFILLEGFENSPLFDLKRTLPADISEPLTKAICDSVDAHYQNSIPPEFTAWETSQTHRHTLPLDYQKLYEEFKKLDLSQKIELYKDRLNTAFQILQQGIKLHNKWNDKDHITERKIFNNNIDHLTNYLHGEIIPSIQELISLLEKLDNQLSDNLDQNHQFENEIRSLIANKMALMPALKIDEQNHELRYTKFFDSFKRLTEKMEYYTKKYHKYGADNNNSSTYDDKLLIKITTLCDHMHLAILKSDATREEPTVSDKLTDTIFKFVDDLRKTSIPPENKDLILQLLLNQSFSKSKEDKEKITLITHAIKTKNYRFFKTLLIAGADPTPAIKMISQLNSADKTIFITMMCDIDQTHPHLHLNQYLPKEHANDSKYEDPTTKLNSAERSRRHSI